MSVFPANQRSLPVLVAQFASRLTPARLTTQASAVLSRRFLFVLALVYIFAGLFFRDPWKSDDVAGLAAMMTTAYESGQTWLLPQLGQLAYAKNGPLPTWAGALSIWLFSPLFELFLPQPDATIAAARLPNLLWFGLIAYAVWYGSYLLGRRPEAQPLPLPFGGEPSPPDYGRMIADAALLLTLATAGIMWRLHETSEVPALIASQAMVFLAAARLLSRPRTGALLLGVALAATFLSRGLIGGLPVLAAVLCCAAPGLPLWPARRWTLAGLLLAAGLLTLWWWPAYQANPYWAQSWWHWNLNSFEWPSSETLNGSIWRDLPWFLWPTWPFALMALWQWRMWIRAPHIWLPLMMLLCPLITLWFLADPFEPEYSLLAIPSAALAAFALPTLRRGVVNSLDWFAVMCFSLACATTWLGWIALQTGWPSQIARNIARQTEGFNAQISWLAFTLAALGTLAWILLVRWRLLSKPAALWRGTVVYAGGIVLTWLLLATLWMPALDYARSYRPVSRQLAQAIAQHLQPDDCVRAYDLGLGQRASFLVFDQIDFSFGRQCSLVLQQTSQQNIETGSAAFSNDSARVLWVGKRGADRKGQEIFRLLRLNQP